MKAEKKYLLKIDEAYYYDDLDVLVLKDFALRFDTEQELFDMMNFNSCEYFLQDLQGRKIEIESVIEIVDEN